MTRLSSLVVTLGIMFLSAFTAYQYKHWYEHYNTGILFPYSNGALHEWACNAVYEYKPNDKGGCYDICLGLTGSDVSEGTINNTDLPIHIQNACAVTLNGAEW